MPRWPNDECLEFEDCLRGALARLGLVGRIAGRELGARNDRAYGGGDVMTVVAGATYPCQPTHTIDREIALLHGWRQRFDDRVDAVTPSPSLGRRASLTCRKAC